MEALARFPLESITWGVLTLHPGDCAGVPLGGLYTGLVERWTRLARSLRKEFGRFHYHLSVEAHASGRPHMNLVVVSQALADELRARPPTASDARDGRAPHWWRDFTAEAGFGWRASLEHVADRHAVAAYVTKFEKGAVTVPHSLGAEVVKLSQLPTMAPKRTRRIRSSKGFLPPLRYDPDVSGRLVRTPLPARQAEAADAGYRALGSHLGAAAPPGPTLPEGYEKMRGEELRSRTYDWWWHVWRSGGAEADRTVRARVAARQGLAAVPDAVLEARAARAGLEGWRYELELFAHAARGNPVHVRKEESHQPQGASETSKRAVDNAHTSAVLNTFQDLLEAHLARARERYGPLSALAAEVRGAPRALGGNVLRLVPTWDPWDTPHGALVWGSCSRTRADRAERLPDFGTLEQAERARRRGPRGGDG